MPLYNYVCKDCENKAKIAKNGEELTAEEFVGVIFETSHRIEPTPEELAEARVCPRCEGSNTEMTVFGIDVLGYIRGNGYLDRAGCRRDMNLHKLTAIDPDTGQTTDPYAEYREPGEVDDLKVRLKRAGQHDPNTSHFTT